MEGRFALPTALSTTPGYSERKRNGNPSSILRYERRHANSRGCLAEIDRVIFVYEVIGQGANRGSASTKSGNERERRYCGALGVVTTTTGRGRDDAGAYSNRSPDQDAVPDRVRTLLSDLGHVRCG